MYYTAHVQLKHVLREKRTLILIIIVPQQIVIYLTYFKDGLGSGRKWIISRIFSKSTYVLKQRK